MARGLLIGNGINLYQGIKELSAERIATRFIKVLPAYNPIIYALFGMEIQTSFIEHIIASYTKKGIESIAEELYRYIWRNSKKEHSVNFQYRLLDAINNICLCAIFFEKSKRVDLSPTKDLFDLSPYDEIYTLNYIEPWDCDNKCVYLHGKFDPGEVNLAAEKDVLLIERSRLYLEDVKIAVQNMSQTYNVYSVGNKVILAPESIGKQEMENLGVYPSNNLYPAEDLFLRNPRKLYSEMINVDEIDVFGVSPYGDADLFSALSDIRLVRVFVYDISNNLERDLWKDLLYCKYEIYDSEEIGKY